jgi:hypothetical protein
MGQDSVLFVTLDSCRFDTFRDARTPAMDQVGALHMSTAPSHFTYASHAAMFMGFTPIATTDPVPLLNPKYAKLFKLNGPGFGGRGEAGFVLDGADIVDGFSRAGYRTFGTGATRWFDPATPPSQLLNTRFDDFFYPGDYWSADRQVEWLGERLHRHRDDPVFAFANLAETHAPYWHRGATWSRDDNPCVPFQAVDRQADCAHRQRACLEHLDGVLAPLLAAFQDATILLCGDHGDCWGEDGLWEHGISHPMTLTVPMMMRLRGRAIDR